jgi:excisionase family DNA binding protein
MTGEYLMSVGEVSDKVSMSKTTIYELIAAGKFPIPMRINGSDKLTRWRGADIDAWIAEEAGKPRPWKFQKAS